METNKKALRELFVFIVGCIVVYWVLHDLDRVSDLLKSVFTVLSPFVIGAALAFILNVPMRGIESRLLRGVKHPGLRRAMAILLTIVVILLVLALVVGLLIPQIGKTIESVAAELPDFFRRTEKGIEEFLADRPEVLNWIQENTDLEQFDWMSVASKLAKLAGNSVSKILNGAMFAVGSVASAVVNAVIGIVFALYALSRKEILARQGRRLLYSFVPEHICDQIVRILRLTNSTFSNFISGQCLEACLLGTMFAVAMWIFGMPYVPLVSVLVAVTALIPLVGAFVGCIFGAFFILVESPFQAVWFVVMFLVLQQIENNLIYPRVVGTSIGLPGMWVLVAVTVGGDLMGVGGMLLMIPLTSVLYALCREFTDSRLRKRQISSEKLEDHPPELQSKFKEKRQQAKNRHIEKAATTKKKK